MLAVRSRRGFKAALLTLLAAPALAGADADPGGAEAERAQAAQVGLFPLPGPLYDEAGRLLAVPQPSDVRSARDVLLRLPVLPEAVGDAGSEPRRRAPPRRGEP
jgi:hypothetical protein